MSTGTRSLGGAQHDQPRTVSVGTDDLDPNNLLIRMSLM